MNAERRATKEAERVREIGPEPAERHLGHFAIRAVNDALGVASDLAYLQVPSGFRFSLAELLSSLVYARCVAPRSKSRTFHDVMPLMEGAGRGFSLDQLYDGLAYLGEEHEKSSRSTTPASRRPSGATPRRPTSTAPTSPSR